MTLNKTAKQIISVLLQVLLFLVIMWGYSEWKARNLLPKGSVAPDFSLADLDGKTRVLSEHRGSKVLLYFFSPSCRACKFTSGNISAVAESGNERLTVYAMALSWQNTAELRKYAADNKVNLEIIPAGNDIAEKYMITAYPTIYIIDENGGIEERIIGYTTKLGLRLRLL